MIDTAECEETRISLGVYVLGALDAAERAEVDAHLTGCNGCRAELADLETLPILLASLSEEEVATLAAPSPHELAVPLAGAEGQPTSKAVQLLAAFGANGMRRRVRPALGLAVAAAIALATLGGAELGGRLGQPDQGPYAGPALGSWQSSQGSGPDGLRATVRYRPMGWGTQLAVQVSGIPVHTRCTIEAFGRNGATAIAGSWTTDANEGHVWYPASAGLAEQGMVKFVITVAGHPSSAITIPL